MWSEFHKIFLGHLKNTKRSSFHTWLNAAKMQSRQLHLFFTVYTQCGTQIQFIYFFLDHHLSSSHKRKFVKRRSFLLFSRRMRITFCGWSFIFHLLSAVCSFCLNFQVGLYFTFLPFLQFGGKKLFVLLLLNVDFMWQMLSFVHGQVRVCVDSAESFQKRNLG